MIGPFPEPTTGVSLANEVVRSILTKQEQYVVKHINTSYTRFDEKVGSFTVHKLLFNLSFYTQCWRVFKCDILYLTPGQSFLGVLKYAGFIVLGALSRKRIITHIHGNHLGNEYQSLSGLKKKVFYALVSKTTQGIVLSDSLKGNLSPFIAKEAIEVLPNFAQDYLVDDSISKSFDKLRIIYLSNLMEEKGIFDVLKALQLLEENNISYEAQIAGAIDYSQKEEIEEQIDTLIYTTYVGIVKAKAKKELLQWGNIFVLPTYYKMEGQPISILEAMATGNVILTTRHAGIPDIVREGEHGKFFTKKEPQELYEALLFYATHKEEISKISDSNKICFKENFTRDQFKERLLDIFDKKL
jgi:glycosyltransferase involved in cell wall biosynthesis